MTYKKLLQQLQQLNEEQLNSDVCIWNSEVTEWAKNQAKWKAATKILMSFISME